jgi:hypothetical protein
MKQRLITGLFFLIWLCQLSDRYVVIVSFYINQDYITKNLCVNRNKPQMHCNGKCHLKDTLKEQSRNEQNNPEQKNEKSRELFYLTLGETYLLEPAFAYLKTIFYPHHPIGTPIDTCSKIFHPPIA